MLTPGENVPLRTGAGFRFPHGHAFLMEVIWNCDRIAFEKFERGKDGHFGVPAFRGSINLLGLLPLQGRERDDKSISNSGLKKRKKPKP